MPSCPAILDVFDQTERRSQPGREVINDIEARSANLDWMWHRHIVAVALRVPRNAGRLAVAAIVGGTRHDDVVARTSVPVEIPPGPGPRNVGLTNGRRLPRRAPIQAVLDAADPASRGPGEATHPLPPRQESRRPRQRERTLDRLLA